MYTNNQPKTMTTTVQHLTLAALSDKLTSIRNNINPGSRQFNHYVRIEANDGIGLGGGGILFAVHHDTAKKVFHRKRNFNRPFYITTTELLALVERAIRVENIDTILADLA